MMLYILYRLGYSISMMLPLESCYKIACAIADIHYKVSVKDREAVVNNLKVIFGSAYGEERLNEMAREVFRNFAKYLADFFRFSKVDLDYIKKNVKVEGLGNIDTALSRGKGVILLSAHIGNWELGGSVLSLIGYPLNAVVLTHQDRKINDFFTRQRMLGRVRPIEIGLGLRNCYSVLKANGLLAVLGDRDFSKNGIYADFFERPTLIPKGPSIFSHRMGSAIVPIFMIREPNDTFRLIAEEPIFPDQSEDEKNALKTLTRKYLPIIESYIKRYPVQWYVFRDIWNDNGKALHPDTIV